MLNLFREIKIGEFSISPAIIVTSVIVLVIGILITRSFQSWLSTRFLPTTRLDIGLRNSIVTGMGYLGFIGSVMIAFSQAGLDLSNLAIVAGALSLGIGFGLQSIVSNFVSGIILLAERPIKAGDWIMVGGEEGTVRKINVRSTEIETFDRATVIVPNADFISGSVKNMMYGNKIGRIIINVGVGYDSDANEVREHLLEVAKAHPLLLTYPEAQVVFMDFGASSLDFQLRGFIADCGNSLSVRSDLRFAIFTKLKEVGIEIPFPQRDLHIKTTQGDVMQYVASDAEPTTQIQRKDQRMSAEIENDAGDD
ncbi:MAG: mechanosensitive ion channel domain-containing protein [Hyphomicrobiales bacterium]